MKSSPCAVPFHFCLALALASGTLLAQGPGHGGGGRGQGPGGGGFQEAIHDLFDNHAKIKRTVEMTETGYRSRTVSEDPTVAKTLQKHVREMRERLGAGLMIRRWDPAFAELVEHYEQIDHEFREVEGGVEMVATGKTPEAVKVAQNHARIVSGFVEKGSSQMHETHPRALGPTTADKSPRPGKPPHDNHPEGSNDHTANPTEDGPKIIAEAFGQLSAALTEAIAQDGPAGALPICSEQAPRIAARVGRAHGVTLRRATDRPRNPKNRASREEQAALADFAKALADGHTPTPRVITRDSGARVFLSPILLPAPVCLQCHGRPDTDIAPATLSAIREKYPEDEATGYALGALRGLWSVEFPPEP